MAAGELWGPWLPHIVRHWPPTEDRWATPAAGQKPRFPWIGWLGNWGDVPKEPVWRASPTRERAGHSSPLFFIKTTLQAETYLFLNLLISIDKTSLSNHPLSPDTVIVQLRIPVHLIVIFISFE